MRLLLDTHIWLWALGDPQRLSPHVRKELGNASNEVWLSPISIWELLLLDARKRITINVPAEEWIAGSMKFLRALEAPVTHEVALEAGRIKLPHRDPADRFLVATANVFGLTLVTADKALIAAKLCPIMASR